MRNVMVALLTGVALACTFDLDRSDRDPRREDCPEGECRPPGSAVPIGQPGDAGVDVAVFGSQ
jgi:hypothetical protein